MDNTIITNSNLGKRLEHLKKHELLKLSFRGKFFPIVSKITIGRDKKNTIYVGDKLASRVHAVVQKIKNAYFIKDLDSTNGTFINDRQVPKNKYVKLYKNDVLRIGRTEVTIL